MAHFCKIKTIFISDNLSEGEKKYTSEAEEDVKVDFA